jgi:hypothetical protein
MTSTLGAALLLTAVATLYKALFGKSQGAPGAAQAHKDPAQPVHRALPVLFGAVIGCW